MTIETPRLLLRPWCETDAPALYHYASDPRVGPAAGWCVHASVEESRACIRSALSGAETYALVPRGETEPVGSAGIKLLPECSNAAMRETDAELGYWIGVPYWGRGLVPEAVRALLRRCFTELGRERVFCGYYDGNEKSRRVQEKCGFLPHHTEKDVPCPLLGETRTEHFTCLTRARWEALQDEAHAGARR